MTLLRAINLIEGHSILIVVYLGPHSYTTLKPKMMGVEDRRWMGPPAGVRRLAFMWMMGSLMMGDG